MRVCIRVCTSECVMYFCVRSYMHWSVNKSACDHAKCGPVLLYVRCLFHSVMESPVGELQLQPVPMLATLHLLLSSGSEPIAFMRTMPSPCTVWLSRTLSHLVLSCHTHRAPIGRPEQMAPTTSPLPKGIQSKPPHPSSPLLKESMLHSSIAASP